MALAQLENWVVVYANEDPYGAPEQAGIALKGRVKGHPRKRDGQLVRTSPITTVEGRVVTTQSGTQYRLGEPLPEYRQWLQEHRPEWDPENPVSLGGL